MMTVQQLIKDMMDTGANFASVTNSKIIKNYADGSVHKQDHLVVILHKVSTKPRKNLAEPLDGTFE